MTTGQLRHRIEIQSSTATRGNSGSVPLTWSSTPFETVWAARRQLKAFERTTQVSETPLEECVWVIRYLSGVSTDMRIKFDTDYFDIVGINHTDATLREYGTVWTELRCIKGKSKGS